ncbi:MAG: TonB-dependent receptor plug domain-containing protein [Alistipes sp.]|jgi:iron complex outermembrane receptor protein|nr:TonB-dependent receptor plug domain-containing protein [Alistipes sp.]
MYKQTQQEPVWCFRRWSRKPWSAFAGLCRLKIGVLSVAMSIILLATAGTVAAMGTAQHAGLDSLPEGRMLHLDSVQVTARPGGAPLGPVSQTRFLVDRKVPAGNAEALLRLLPGIDIRERGGKSTQADIAIRGGSFDQTMVMLNGIDFSDARTGHQSLSLPVDLDVVSDLGVTEALTGPGALSGGVDFRTDPLFSRYLRARLEGGAWGYGYGNISGAWSSDTGSGAGASSGAGGLKVMGAASYRRSDGYRHNTDFWNTNAYGRVIYESRRAGLFDAQAGFQRREWGSNGFYSLKYPEQFESTLTALASLRWSRNWRRLGIEVTGSARRNDDLFAMVRDNPDPAAGGVPFNYHTTWTTAGSLTARYSWAGAGVSSLGAEWKRDLMLSSAMGELLDHPSRPIPGAGGELYPRRALRDITGARAGHRKDWSRAWLSAEGALTRTRYGDEGTFAAEAGWRPARIVLVKAGARRSMRLPTFTDLYYNVAIYHPDPDLKPETAMTWSLGAAVSPKTAPGAGRWYAEGSVWYRRTRDVIDWEQRTGEEPGDVAGHWYSTQLNRLGTFGGEMAVQYSGGEGEWLRRASMSYGYLHSDMTVATGYISKYALDYMRHKASALASVGLSRALSVTLTGSFYDRVGSYVAADDTVEGYSPYFLLDGRLSWEPSGRTGRGESVQRESRFGGLQIYLDATNITGTRYFDYGGLPMPRTWLSAGIVVTIR